MATAPTLQQLQDQQRQAQQDYNNLQSPTGPYGPQYQAYEARRNQLMQRLQSLSQQTQQAQASAGGDATAQGRLDQILGSARGDIDRFAKDPVDALLIEQLKARATGGGPYNEEVRNSLMTQAGEDAAHVQMNDMANIRGGGNPTDPSVQSQISEANARRQSALQQARLGIGQVANLANYNAQGQALGQLSGFNQGRQGGLTNREHYLNDVLGQINNLQQTQMQAPSVMSFMPQTPQVETRTPSAPWGGFSNQGSGTTAPVAKPPAQQPPATHIMSNPPTQNPGWTPTSTGWTPQGGNATGGVPGNNAYQFYQPQQPQTQVATTTKRNTDPRLGPVADPYGYF